MASYITMKQLHTTTELVKSSDTPELFAGAEGHNGK